MGRAGRILRILVIVRHGRWTFTERVCSMAMQDDFVVAAFHLCELCASVVRNMPRGPQPRRGRISVSPSQCLLDRPDGDLHLFPVEPLSQDRSNRWVPVPAADKR